VSDLVCDRTDSYVRRDRLAEDVLISVLVSVWSRLRISS
jgi:hypothetical protein